MRVLQIAPSLDPQFGGPSHSIPALCRALRAAGVDVVLYTFRRSGAEETTPVNGESFPIERFRPFPGTAAGPTITYYRKLRQELNQFDLVHLNCLWNPPITVAAFACRQVGVPYVISPRGMLQEVALRHKWWLKKVYFWMWEAYTIAGARALHFFTEAEALDFRRLLNGTTPFIVIPSGIDPYLPEGVSRGRFRQAYPSLEGKRIILFLGRLHWSKGLDLQVQALARLVTNFHDLVWVLVGPDGGEWQGLYRRITGMGLERHVLWTGHLPRKECLEALADADVFLLTSRHEAHSMAMNEALAIGLPVVITDTIGFKKVQEWGAGYTVPWNPDHLAAAIADILQHPKQAEQMRVAGRQLVVEHLAWPRIAEQMVRAYKNILTAQQPKQPAVGPLPCCER